MHGSSVGPLRVEISCDAQSIGPAEARQRSVSARGSWRRRAGRGGGRGRGSPRVYPSLKRCTSFSPFSPEIMISRELDSSSSRGEPQNRGSQLSEMHSQGLTENKVMLWSHNMKEKLIIQERKDPWRKYIFANDATAIIYSRLVGDRMNLSHRELRQRA
jgi:hypothetical protein